LDSLGFSEISEKPKGGRPATDFALTIDTAKEISMIQRSEKGKIARRYFIECEKRLKGQISTPPENVTLPRKNNPMTITGKKHLMFQKLIQDIKLNLFMGNLQKISEEHGIPRSKITSEMDCRSFNMDIIRLVYEKAITNKTVLEKDIQQMINNLRQTNS